ncbi:MAG TPA: hypothetical protein VEX17_04645, partial [Bacillales bacterium]|nr:hypothetical protein [Bacillales bacterium]
MHQEKCTGNPRSFKNVFEFPGSVSHQTPFLPFTISHMQLKVKPDMSKNTLVECKQKLRITILQDLKEIKLDMDEMKIHKIH